MRTIKRKPPIPEAELQEAARIIWGEYFNFLLSGLKPGEEGEIKAVSARHTTGKVILAHLDQLWKQGAPGEDAACAEAGDGHLSEARAGLATFKGEEACTDDDDGDG